MDGCEYIYMSTYTYSLNSDFGNSLKMSQLHSLIVADGTITTQLNGVTMTGDRDRGGFGEILKKRGKGKGPCIAHLHTHTGLGTSRIEKQAQAPQSAVSRARCRVSRETWSEYCQCQSQSQSTQHPQPWER